eukprot:1188058-Prorocentrum_minimum.AAC.1
MDDCRCLNMTVSKSWSYGRSGQLHIMIGPTVNKVYRRSEEEYPAPEGGWARCEHHVEQLGPGTPRPCRRVATTDNGPADSTSVIPRPLWGPRSWQLVWLSYTVSLAGQ